MRQSQRERERERERERGRERTRRARVRVRVRSSSVRHGWQNLLSFSVFSFSGKRLNELCQRCVNSSKRTEFGRPHSSSAAVAALVLHEARTEHQKTRKETKREGERRRRPRGVSVSRWLREKSSLNSRQIRDCNTTS